MCPKCGSHQVIKIGDNHSDLLFLRGVKSLCMSINSKNTLIKWIEKR